MASPSVEVLHALGVSLASIARAVGCSTPYVSNMLAGRCPLRRDVAEAIRELAGELALRRVVMSLEGGHRGRAA